MLKKALVIGINNYPGVPLNGCENDAQVIAELLSTHEDGSNNFSVVLEKKIRTRAELRARVIKLFEGNGDVALLYFSGHGMANELGEYLVTPDVVKYDEGILMDDILKLAIQSRVRSKIIILDCCYSGAMGGNFNAIKSTSLLGDGMVILAACNDNELAKEVSKHGVFTSLLIDALKGGAADILGHIGPGGIYGYIEKALGAWDQRPVFKTNVSQFISLRNTAAQIDVAILRKIPCYFDQPDKIYKLDRTYEFTNPEAIVEHVQIFKHLQKMESVGLIKPYDEDHLYYAAQNSKGCYLTQIGQSYWRLVKEGRI